MSVRAVFCLGLSFIIIPAARAIDYCDSEVPSVTPGNWASAGMTPPSDANVLFDGKDLSGWIGKDGRTAAWDVRDGVLTVRKGSGDIETHEAFQDIQLHIEWRIPEGITGEGQHRGNSGVFLMGKYEIQILDSYQNRTYADGQAGAVYGQVAPLMNAMRPPGEWNNYDIIFTAPRFNENGGVFSAARVTVLHNGVLIQNNAEILGATGAWGRPGYYESVTSGPIRLQDHAGPDKPVSFRNIWIRQLNAPHSTASAGNSTKVKTPVTMVSTRTIADLIADPATRSVLARCVPELVPSAAILQYAGDKTLEQLKGEVDITLTDARLRLIETELVRARNASPLKP
jgi:hypothetical protein